MLQKLIVKQIIATLKPKAIHTQTRLYQKLLQKFKNRVIYLPLFGNVPFSNKEIQKKSKKNNTNIQLVIFGTVHPGAPIREFSKEVASYSLQTGNTVSLFFLGRCGNYMESWVKEWQIAGLPYQIIGEQEPSVLSKILSESSFGVSTTPLALIEKSGSVATMLEHGLPVICVSKKWTARNIYAPILKEGICSYHAGSLHSLFANPKGEINSMTLQSIAKQFISDLT